MPCGAQWDGWIHPPGWLEERWWPRSNPSSPILGSPVGRITLGMTGGVGWGDPASPQGRWDWSRLGTGMAQCHPNRSPLSCALQPQTG